MFPRLVKIETTINLSNFSKEPELMVSEEIFMKTLKCMSSRLVFEQIVNFSFSRWIEN